MRVDPDRYLPFLITALTNKLSSGSSRTYRRLFKVGIVEWRILVMMALEPGVTMNRICDVVGIDKSAVSRGVAALESRGFLRITRDARGNRWCLWLTDAGEAMHNRILAVALARENALLTGFSPEERDQLLSFARRLLANLPLANGVGGEQPLTLRGPSV